MRRPLPTLPTLPLLPLLLAAATAFTALTAAPTTAHADRRDEAARAWGILTFEVGEIPAVYFATRKNRGTLAQQTILWTPVLLGIGVAYAAHRNAWDPSVPRGIHGAAWTGFDLFLLGGLIEGRDGDGFEPGTASWVMAGLGAMGGAWVGAREIDSQNAEIVWFSGVLGGGLAALIAQTWSQKKTTQVLGWCGFVGITLGLGAGYVLALTDDDVRAPAGGAAFTPSPGGATMFTLSGVF